jgi:hypothetical protein
MKATTRLEVVNLITKPPEEASWVSLKVLIAFQE